MNDIESVKCHRCGRDIVVAFFGSLLPFEFVEARPDGAFILWREGDIVKAKPWTPEACLRRYGEHPILCRIKK